ncbi:MAG: methyltransferase domain-containing protein [Nitrospira sp.]|nr:methyltransferase domain-containing protein [Nitrospira sp.]
MTLRDKYNKFDWVNEQRKLWDLRATLNELCAVMDPQDKNGLKNRYLTALHLSHLKRHLKKRVMTSLEIGCGIGRLMKMLFSVSNRVIGVDISPKMISVAQKKFPDVEFFIASGDDLPIEDSVVDLIITVWVLQHVLTDEALLAFMRECCRVTMGGSRAIIIEQVTFDSNLRSKEGSEYHIRREPSEYHNIFRNAGWKVLFSYPVRAHPCLGLRKPILLRLSKNSRMCWIASNIESIWARIHLKRSEYIDWCFVLEKNKE